MDTNNTPTKDKAAPIFWVIFFIVLIVIWSVGGYYGSKVIVGVARPLITTRQYINPIYLRAPKKVRSILEVPDVGMVAKICTTHKTMFWAFDSLVSDSNFEIYCRSVGDVSVMSNDARLRRGALGDIPCRSQKPLKLARFEGQLARASVRNTRLLKPGTP